MNDHLLPCPSCARHARAFEDACPFCAAALPVARAAAPAPRVPAARLSRAAMFALGATAAAVAACGGYSSTAIYGAPAVDAGEDAPLPTPLYGGPPSDAGHDAPILVDAAYGGPPKDAGSDADASPEGGPAPLYGAPPP